MPCCLDLNILILDELVLVNEKYNLLIISVLMLNELFSF